VERCIELCNVTYSYPRSEEESLKQISLTVEQGKLVVLMGHTGAGKTTLSLCLNGLIPHLIQGNLTGEIRVAGQETRKQRVQDLARLVGLVLQDAESQIIGRTVEEDVAFGPRNLALPLAEIRTRVEQALEDVRLQGYAERSAVELSGGEKQRLVIAGILAMEPEIMVLDEPASELDPQGRTELYRTLDELRRKKRRTLLVIEHSSEEILPRADEIVVLKQGEIVWRGEPTELFRNIPLLKEFGIKPLPMSLIGWELCQKGRISPEEIPLDVGNAERMIRKLFGKDYLSGRRKQAVSHFADREIAGGQGKVDRDLTDNPLLLEARQLVHCYNSGQTALQGVELKVRRGEFVALVGSNGAGKTTLAKHFNALLKPTEGDVFVKGMNTREYETAQLARTVGYVFQNPDHQIFSVSVEKELGFGLKNVGFAPAEREERIAQALELTGLTKYRQVHPYTLGKGERQLLAVASVLALTPEILVIDEPTTGLDWNGVEKIMALLQQLHRQGTTIIMISHDMDIVAEYAERVVVMHKGQIILDEATWSALTDFEKLQQAAILPPQIAALSQSLLDLGPGLKTTSAEEFRRALTDIMEEGEQELCL
jgi:energy-coupling factor transport system ATP-binding protein